jgi:uncharacterized protein YqeY
MRSKDEGALRALRSIKSAILLAKTEKGASEELDEDQELKILQKLAKQRRESLDIFQKQGREDLAKDEQIELAVIEKFLPAQMSEEDVKAIVSKIATDAGLSGAQNIGKLMPLVMKELSGKADGKLISQLVKEVLG